MAGILHDSLSFSAEPRGEVVHREAVLPKAVRGGGVSLHGGRGDCGGVGKCREYHEPADGDFAAHLPRPGDQMLAVFAQPGKLMCAKGANPRRIDEKSYAVFEAYTKNELAVENDIAIDTTESREITELKQIVNGMREEMREYLANGNGTPRSFWRRLNERTAQEMQIYERTMREPEKDASETTWEQKIMELRSMAKKAKNIYSTKRAHCTFFWN